VKAAGKPLYAHLAGAEYAKASPSESVDRRASAAVEKCSCLWRRADGNGFVSGNDVWLPWPKTPLTQTRDEGIVSSYASAAYANALGEETKARAQEVANYILDTRAGANGLGNPHQAWEAVDQMISACGRVMGLPAIIFAALLAATVMAGPALAQDGAHHWRGPHNRCGGCLRQSPHAPIPPLVESSR
jgi:hypothetical protein